MNSTDYQLAQLTERVRELEHRLFEELAELREEFEKKLKAAHVIKEKNT